MKVLLAGATGTLSIPTLEVSDGGVSTIRLVVNLEKLESVPPLRSAETEEGSG